VSRIHHIGKPQARVAQWHQECLQVRRSSARCISRCWVTQPLGRRKAQRPPQPFISSSRNLPHRGSEHLGVHKRGTHQMAHRSVCAPNLIRVQIDHRASDGVSSSEIPEIQSCLTSWQTGIYHPRRQPVKLLQAVATRMLHPSPHL
jgi:hypothetical protein